MTSMPTVLVTGATGFVGRALCASLVRHNMRVRAAVRQHRSRLALPIETVEVGDIGPTTDWRRALPRIDVVIHLAARVHVLRESAEDPLEEFLRVNVEGTRRLAEAAAGRARRLVYVSSVHAMCRSSNAMLDEASPCRPDSPYGQSKWQAEQTLHSIAERTGLEVVIVRPAPVYGPVGIGNLACLLQLVLQGWPLPLRGMAHRRSLLFVENLVDALSQCATHAAAPGQTFLVSDGDDVSLEELARRAAAVLGRTPRLLPAPLGVMRLAGKCLGRSAAIERMTASLMVSNEKIGRVLNWRPPFTLDQGLSATMNSLQGDASRASVA